MMELTKIKTVYFLGIGGIGMSALARFFLLQKKKVFGYDLTQTYLTNQLNAEGATLHFDENINAIPENVDLVIYTPAVPKSHAEYQYFLKRNIPILKRSEVLGLICKNFPTIAIAGTHGKTTTTSLVTQMLANQKNIPHKILSFMGGIANNFNSNFAYEDNFDTVICEADEYDKSFLTLFPKVAIITSIDADHLDIYGNKENMKETFQLFANQIDNDGTLIIYDEIAEQIEHPKKITYGFSSDANYQLTNLQYFSDKITFTIHNSQFIIHNFTLSVPGKHNALNAVSAFAAVCEYLKCKYTEIPCIENLLLSKLASFKGVKRRFDIRIMRNDLVYIDDYAHHPEEIKTFLEAVRINYPTKRITGVFQPHLFSRTRDFAAEFARELELLDEIILLEIYPARELPIEGIDSNYLLSLIKNRNKKILDKEELFGYFQKNKPEILLTIGAGDIDTVVTILEKL